MKKLVAFSAMATALTDEKQHDFLQDSYLFGGHLPWRNPESSLFGGGNHDDDSGDAAEFIDHIITAGFTHRFGTPSIKETDRYGATLDLPNFGRWVSAGEVLS